MKHWKSVSKCFSHALYKCNFTIWRLYKNCCNSNWLNTVRVWIFAGYYNISRFSRIVLHLRNYSWGTIAHVTWNVYVCAQYICKISCLSSVDDDDLDRILEGLVSDELVAITESWKWPLPGALSISRWCVKNLCYIYALLGTWKTLASSVRQWHFIPAKIKHRRGFPQNAKINSTKICTTYNLTV